MHLPMFTRWRCITHKVGSYNFNMMGRHEFEACEIVTDVTVGVVKPKTYGGVNGDISRAYCPEWIELCKFKENQKKIFSKWGSFVEKERLKIFNYRKKIHAHKTKRVLQH